MRHGKSEKVLSKQKLLSCSLMCTLKAFRRQRARPPNSPTKHPTFMTGGATRQALGLHRMSSQASIGRHPSGRAFSAFPKQGGRGLLKCGSILQIKGHSATSAEELTQTSLH